MKDLEKKKESTKIEKIEVKSIEELNSSDIPQDAFQKIECKRVSQKELQKSAKKMTQDTLGDIGK